MLHSRDVKRLVMHLPGQVFLSLILALLLHSLLTSTAWAERHRKVLVLDDENTDFPDLAIAVMGPTLNFLLCYGGELFPGTARESACVQSLNGRCLGSYCSVLPNGLWLRLAYYFGSLLGSALICRPSDIFVI